MGQVPEVTYLLIGGGRLARHLQFYLRSLDLKLQTWTRREPVSNLKVKLGTASHVLLAIPDREIEKFQAEYLTKFTGKVVHFSGALATASASSAHPLMTFGESLYSFEKYLEIPFVIEEGSKFSELLPGLPNKSFAIAADKKALYHAYCVMSGNFSTLLWEKFFSDLKNELGIPAVAAKAYLKQVAENLLAVADGDSPSALTGPLVRGDLETVHKNLSALDKNFDSYSGVYRAFLTAESHRFNHGGLNANRIRFPKSKNNGKKISMITCYDHWTAKIVADSKLDCILVGDSVAMVAHGHSTTLPATVEVIASHVAAVRRGAPNKFIVADMPFLAHRGSIDSTMAAVAQLMRAGAQAVKIEGVDGSDQTIHHIVESGVPVMAHLGLTPQSIHQFGGFKVQATQEAAALKLLEQAKRVERAGCFALVLECVPSEVAKKVTAQLNIPTIGIGAGADTSGQVLVMQDLLGMNPEFAPKFVRRFLNGHELFKSAFDQFDQSVKEATFPNERKAINANSTIENS